MSKMTLGQRKLPTLGRRSTLPKSYVGPTLSCYLGLSKYDDLYALLVLSIEYEVNVFNCVSEKNYVC